MELKNTFDRRRCALFCFLSVFIWGLIAHGYAFGNLSLSHDGMNEFGLKGAVGYAPLDVAGWKLSIGRFFEPVYLMVLKGGFSSPWLSGILALVWISLLLWVLTRMLPLCSPLAVILSAGILTANLTVTAGAAGFMADLDAHMCAAFLSALGAYYLMKGGKKRLLAIPCLVISMGIYQPMLSVCLTLVLLTCVMDFIKNKPVRDVLIKGLLSVLICAVSCGIYLPVAKCACGIFHIAPAQTYNGFGSILNFDDNSILASVYLTYKEATGQLLFPVSPWSKDLCVLLRLGIFAFDAFLLIRAFLREKTRAGNLIWTLICLAAAPLCMNAACFLSGGRSHILMYYAVWMADLLPLMLLKGEGKASRALTAFLLGAVLLSCVQTSNALYVRRQSEQNAAFSAMTRVLDRIEATDGYLPGETEVLLIGVPEPPQRDAFSFTYRLIGSRDTSPISGESYYGSFFAYLLPSDIRLCGETRREALTQQIDIPSLPVFPADGSLLWRDGTLVLRLN